MNPDLERALTWGFHEAPPEAVAALLADLAERVPRAPFELWDRHEVFPAAVALRDNLVTTLRGRRQLTPYETLRLDARRCGLLLDSTISYFRHLCDEGRDVDVERMLAYEDELAAQQSPQDSQPAATPRKSHDPSRLAHLLDFVVLMLDEEPDTSFSYDTVLVAGENLVAALQARVHAAEPSRTNSDDLPWAACA